jgi:hypothetical protein
MIDDNIKAAISRGDECIVCETPTVKGTRVIACTFKVNVLVGKIAKTVETHIDCARDLEAVIHRRIQESQ